jgi:hypothetical protein
MIRDRDGLFRHLLLARTLGPAKAGGRNGHGRKPCHTPAGAKPNRPAH